MTRATPVQARAHERLSSLTEAAKELIAEHGREYVTTAMVAERAGCSIGTLYRYFDDIHEVLDAVEPIHRHGVSRVLELHSEGQGVDVNGEPFGLCKYDSERWPCATRVALVGEARND